MDKLCIGNNTHIDSTCKLSGNIIIGNNCNIGPFNVLKNVTIGDNNDITSSYIEDSKIENNCQIGPFSHIRNNSIIMSNCRVGNYVEIKNSILHEGVKCAHLSYVGDCEIGEGTNVGCGVITANYDGKKKHQTKIGRNCFIGCNSVLIAPLEIKDNSFIAAGTIVTSSLEKNSFAISRSKLEIKERK